MKALNTPGHSPDSISVVAINEDGKEEAVLTGDTLFIDDVAVLIKNITIEEFEDQILENQPFVPKY